MATNNNNADGGSGWSSPANASGSDNSYATTTAKNTTCNFSLDNGEKTLTDSDTINSVTIHVEASVLSGGGKDYIDVGLVVDGVLQGALLRQQINGNDTVYTFTDAATLGS